MAETEDPLRFDPQLATKPFPWGPLFVVVTFIALGCLAFWVTREKKNDEARTALISSLDKELSVDELAVKAQRSKVDDLSQRVEDLRTKILTGGVKDKKAAVTTFNQLAAQQRAEREKFIQMADTYNQKVSKYRQLEQ
jgi:hypothetical protein